jgi:diguanylate cyclase (GGDEF)-like protein/PAS domain S-box-containing protein
LWYEKFQERIFGLFAALSFLGFVVSLAAGVVVFYQNKKRFLNIIFGCSCLFVSIWSLSEFMYRQADSYATASLWIKVRALAWTYPLAFLFHFLLIFTKKRKWLKAKITPFLIYGPAVLFSAVDVGTHSITGRPVLKPWGYTYDIPDSWINWLCNGWAALLGILALILALRYYYLVPDRRKKIEAKYIALGISLPILSGILSEIVLPEFDIRIPELTSVSMTWLALFIGYAIWKYELFAVSPAMAAENIIATMNEMLFLLNPEGAIIRTNRKSREVLGYEESELVGRPVGVVMSDEPTCLELMDQIRKEGSVQSAEILLRTKPGGRIPAIFSGSMIMDRRGMILGIVGVSRDISDRKRMEEELRALSLIDELTGLYNRRGFLTLARHQQKISARTGKEMLLVYADVDDLKRINDTFGHDAGDAALAETAKILKESFRSSDLTARLGGDEFVVLVLEAAAPCSEQLKARLEEKLLLRLAGSAFPFKLSLSVGMVCCDPKIPSSIEELLAKADQAMYARKPGRKAN